MSIKIYTFQNQDLSGFEFNHYSRHLRNKKNLAAMKVYLNHVNSFTIFDTILNKAVAVLAFAEYEPYKFQGCIIASRQFANNPKYAAKIRYLINCLKRDYAAVRVETISADLPKLNRWHEFLGFKIEKKIPGYYQNRDYNLWSM